MKLPFVFLSSNRNLLGALLGGLFIGLLSASLGACSKQQALAKQEITFAVAQAPLNLDPRYATDAASERVNRLIYQSLVDFDSASKPIPELATWQKIKATQYRFTLTNLDHFHHGKLLTAEDVMATYQSIAQLKDSPHTAEFANIERIELLNTTTLDFYLKQPDEHFAAKLIIGILPKYLIEKRHDFAHQPIGSGALKFVSWSGKLSLKRVSDGQQVNLIEVKDPTVRVLKLIRGEVDLLQGDLPPELVRYLQTKPDIQVKTSIGSNFSYLGFNFQDQQLQNHLIRRAVAHAINRQEIISKALVQDTRAAGAILPPEHYAGNTNLNAYDYNPALAKKLLQQAQVKLPLKLVYKTSTDAQRVRLATIMQAQMQAAGIDLEIRSLDWGTFFDDVKHGQFQLYGLTWVGINTPEIYAKAFGSQNFPPNGFNRGRYQDSELDVLLAKEDWKFATERIHTQLPYIPLWYEGQFAAMTKSITQYSPRPNGNWDDLAHIKRSATIDSHAY